jgi:hypothetical protein
MATVCKAVGAAAHAWRNRCCHANYHFASARWDHPAVIVAVAFVAIFPASIFIFILGPLRTRWHYRRYKLIQEPMTIELLEEGVRLSWNVVRWRQNERFILIYPMPAMFYIVPKAIAGNGFDVWLLVQRLTSQVGA